MMQQYLEIKKQYPDCLLLFRLGDFYELFLEDAKIGAKVLDITLTSRDRGKDGRIPMAGVPYHAVDSYLPRLVKAGYKVAICEQVGEITKDTKLVERDVVRVVTPGTLLGEAALTQKENNYMAAFTLRNGLLGMAFADISTGIFYADQVSTTEVKDVIATELSKFSPSECILPEVLYNQPGFLKVFQVCAGLNIYPFFDWDTYADGASAFLASHFGTHTLDSFDLCDKSLAQEATAALLGYLKYTQRGKVSHIREILPLKEENYVSLDRSTIVNLELLSTVKFGDKEGSLVNILDDTCTAMGGRMLRTWLLNPLRTVKDIEGRHNAVEAFLAEPIGRRNLCEELNKIADIERLISRLAVGIGNARDLVNLKTSLERVTLVKSMLADVTRPLVKTIRRDISVRLAGVVKVISEAIVEEPSLDLKNGGLIKDNVDSQLDSLRKEVRGSTDWISLLEEEEREKTGITSLKVRFNQVFGYYIEITKANLDLVPKHYMRKQTLVSTERFITPELKKHEDIVLSAKEKINELEYQIFLEVVSDVLAKIEIIQKAAQAIALLDCLLCFATLAERNDYHRPQIVGSGEISITEGRHPVVEQFLEGSQFVPNDVYLDLGESQLLILTGPNMAGKSVFIRQVALIVLMAQMGSFVPAKEAVITPVDKVFARSGASDVISRGISTFMLEMVETANILNNATSNSLIIMDEVGRGTSTFDGISIAWAVVEHLVSKGKSHPKTLFATHYHELQSLGEVYPKKIKNFQVLVDGSGDDPVFLHKVVEGGADHSYGIAVAKLAGVPKGVVTRAGEILAQLESRGFEKWLSANGKKA